MGATERTKRTMNRQERMEARTRSGATSGRKKNFASWKKITKRRWAVAIVRGTGHGRPLRGAPLKASIHARKRSQKNYDKKTLGTAL